MVLRNSFPNDSVTGQSVLDTRLTNTHLVARDADGNPRLGAVYDRPDPLVEPTASMQYRVRDARFVTSRTGAGVEFVANDGSTLVPTTPAPPSNARIDIVYVRPRFLANSDGSALPEFGVSQGAASTNPQDPALPSGALPLLRARIPSGVTSTQAAGVTFEEICPFTAAAGGTVVVRNALEMAAWTPADGARVFNLADNREYVRVGDVWEPQHGQKVLWTGTMWPTSSQQATLSETVSQQKNGIILVFSRYSGGSASDSNWHYEYVPKFHVTAGLPGLISFSMHNNGDFLRKYITLTDTYVSGADSNSQGNDAGLVLRRVLGH